MVEEEDALDFLGGVDQAAVPLAMPECSEIIKEVNQHTCLLYTSPSPRDGLLSRMPSSA